MNMNTQNGNAIIWIFIAVGLFAALGYAFTSSTRTSTNVITDAQAQSYAQEIIAYGNEVKQAIKRLQLRGCSDTEISFENDVVSGYENPNAPTNKTCHVFDIAGGGLSWNSENSAWFDSNAGCVGSFWCHEFTFEGTNKAPGVGTDSNGTDSMELTIRLAGISSNICEKINELSNQSNPPPLSVFFTYKFDGTYDPNSHDFLLTTPNKSKIGCHIYSTTYYNYYATLIER